MQLKYLTRTLYWLIIIFIVPLISVVLGEKAYPVKAWYLRLMLELTGLLLIIYGIVLNIIAGRTLRIYGHSRNAPRFTQPDKLVDTGIYSCMRHPAQFGLIMFGVGASLMVPSAFSLVGIGIPVAGGLLFLMLVEEPEARRILGEEYCRYEARVPPFTFSPRCLALGLESLREKHL